VDAIPAETIKRRYYCPEYLLPYGLAQRQQEALLRPFPGHKSAPDFLTFEKDTFTIFERDLKEIYFLKGQTLGK